MRILAIALNSACEVRQDTFAVGYILVAVCSNLKRAVVAFICMALYRGQGMELAIIIKRFAGPHGSLPQEWVPCIDQRIGAAAWIRAGIGIHHAL